MNHSGHEKKGRKATAPLPTAVPEQAQPESCPTSCFHSVDALLDDAEADAVQLGSCRGGQRAVVNSWQGRASQRAPGSS